MLLLEFLKYKKLIDREIKKDILEMGEKGLLRDSCEYALLSGGKRFRPIIVMMIAKLLGKDFPALQTATMLIASLVIVINLFVDLTYGLIDPRIRYDN